MTGITAWLVGINLLAFTLFGADKQRAKHKKRRISEKTLFATAMLGGSVGALLGMHLFRHKTNHVSFSVGIPLCLLLNTVTLSLLNLFIS